MKAKLIFVTALLLLLFQTARAREKPSIPEADRVRLAEAFRLSESVGDHIWPGWSKVPFAVLLVTPDYEFLVRHPKPSEDFAPLGYDPLLRCEVFYRKRTYPVRLLATFPAIKGSALSTIVVGQAENTEVLTSTPWVVTLFHEHFHQLQNAQPTYFADTRALNLARGDDTGMWMLNYAFPYDNRQVQERYSALRRLLADSLNAQTKEGRASKLAAYLDARREFQRSLGAEDYKYISFQLWQEGIARYTEYRVAQFAAEHYRPTKEFRALKDYTPFGQLAEELRVGIFSQLQTRQLGEAKRLVVYPFGAAEGLLLDATSPSWRKRYFVDKFDLGKYYEAVDRQFATTDKSSGRAAAGSKGRKGVGLR
ncbi:MAG: hypothetical protein DMF67_01750 [Acidobacteria bacterium]|nr:MAG: hypothetical protein DMF66_02515 [Acidobacteriota bacterium]PYS85249.1 MAG: hypothetical protein DMF67_01750 [Acidobacteriota bacterium]